METVKILMPARMIPVNETVTMRTGEKEYTILDEVRIYGMEGDNNHITADDSTRFLMAGNKINVVSGDKELMWAVRLDELMKFIGNYMASKRSHK